MSQLLTLDQIKNARNVIHPYIHRTVLDPSTTFSTLTGGEILRKSRLRRATEQKSFYLGLSSMMLIRKP